MLKPWNMNWTSCLVRTHPEGEQGLDHMRLGHRIEVINEGFFYPQARAIIGRNDPDRIPPFPSLRTLTNPLYLTPLSQKRDHHASSQQALTDA